MAIAFDASVGLQLATGPLTFAHTCTGSNRILFVGLTTITAGDVVTGVTYAGVAMTRVNIASQGLNCVYLYCLVAPASWANNVVATVGVADVVYGRAASYTGASQVSSTPDNTAADAVSGATTLSVTLTPSRDNCWTVAIFRNDIDNNSTAGTGTTFRSIDGLNSTIMGDSNGKIHPAAATSLTENWAGSGIGICCMASFGPFTASLALTAGGYTSTGSALSFANTKGILTAAGSYALSGVSLSFPVPRIINLSASRGTAQTFSAAQNVAQTFVASH